MTTELSTRSTRPALSPHHVTYFSLIGKGGIRRTSNLLSQALEKENLIKSGAIISNLVEGRVPDIATFNLSLLPRVNASDHETQTAFSEEMLNGHLVVKFEGTTLQNCQNGTHYCSMSVYTTLRDNHNHLTLQRKEFSYDIHRVDETGVRVISINIATHEDVKELESSMITLDCEVAFTVHCTQL